MRTAQPLRQAPPSTLESPWACRAAGMSPRQGVLAGGAARRPRRARCSPAQVPGPTQEVAVASWRSGYRGDAVPRRAAPPEPRGCGGGGGGQLGAFRKGLPALLLCAPGKGNTNSMIFLPRQVLPGSFSLLEFEAFCRVHLKDSVGCVCIFVIRHSNAF